MPSFGRRPSSIFWTPEYVDKIRKILKAKGEDAPNVEVIFVVGKPIDEASNVDRVKASMEAVSKDSRIVLYDQLIDGARKAYAEYLQKSHELDKLEKLVGSLWPPTGCEERRPR